ncbi:MAG: hypothetical protein LKI93_03845 [Bifidobacteriaceae bacterium]|jgi:hypothetical protein|nr:hypothetical protein [Bifidobacteriaceae bacterium]MCI1914410.1 hypothetical protein [Bifidobacteriaceae bacterium]MCI1935862.1 hypothetical protein [Bifidobacteriaceae bacterium]
MEAAEPISADSSIWLMGILATDPLYHDDAAELSVAVTNPDGSTDIWKVHAAGQHAAYAKAKQARKSDVIAAVGYLRDQEPEPRIDAVMICLDTSTTWKKQ